MRLTVLTTPELAPAYRLAGTATLVCSSATEAAAALRELRDGGHEGVIAVHRPFLDELDAAFREELDKRQSALVVGLPSGDAPEAAKERRARLLRLLRPAVGYEMPFESEPGETR